MEAKRLQEVKRKIPKFTQIRRTMYKKKTPKVNLEIAFRNKENDAITTVNSTVAPKSQFPPHRFEKLYEMATVEVIILKYITPPLKRDENF